ncbi:MAG: hypothetical protein WCL21_00835 [Mariniphaga sp.]
MKKQWISILIVGMAFGTAWAIRGQFGHERGAAWAAGIGALALVLVAQRKDWYAKALLIALSSAVGWGAGGMISYGMVVGYGRATDLLNATYGLLMLFVIGGLFGLLGGGLVGLTLGSSEKKRVNWGSLMAEMTAGGLIGYYFLIEQLEFLMTPPRSEAWAACLGAGLAMVWFMVRNNHTSPLRVAYYAAMGAGFGFAFGNFLQILGDVLAIQFNMWNVMEYSIGFFGGSGMAYGVFSSEWPEEPTAPKRWENNTAYLLAFGLVPYLVLSNSNLMKVFKTAPADALQPDNGSLTGSIIAVTVVVAVVITGWIKVIATKNSIGRKEVLTLFVGFWGSYIFISFGVTGAFKGIFPLNHLLYLVNFGVVLILLRNHLTSFFEHPVKEISCNKWFKYAIGIVFLIILLGLIAINIHSEMGGANYRF